MKILVKYSKEIISQSPWACSANKENPCLKKKANILYSLCCWRTNPKQSFPRHILGWQLDNFHTVELMYFKLIQLKWSLIKAHSYKRVFSILVNNPSVNMPCYWNIWIKTKKSVFISQMIIRLWKQPVNMGPFKRWQSRKFKCAFYKWLEWSTAGSFSYFSWNPTRHWAFI